MFLTGISDEAGSSIEKQIVAHRELGWPTLEIRTVDGVNLTSVSDEAFDAVERAVKEAGFAVCSFASTIANWGRRITGDFAVDTEELSRAIPRMHRLGCGMIRVMSWPQGGLESDAWRWEAIRRMKELAQMAEDGGVTLIHENCDGWGGQSVENTRALLSKVNSPALKTVFDTGNPFMHKQDAVDYLTRTLDSVVHVHIKDGRKDETGRDVFTYPNEGSCRVAECLEVLFRAGYDGGISIEPHLAAIIHTGEGTGEEKDKAKHDSYLEYGRRLERLVAEVRGRVGAA